MNDSRFDELEQLNAQVDVWIDQEEFGFVLNAFEVSPFENDAFEKAFSDGHCTHHLDPAWNLLLDVTSSPYLKKFRLHKEWTPFSPSEHEIDGAELEELWAKFFWAKLIRAKIQQKGSDCYFRRLDQVIVFLERNQPIVKKPSGIKNIIANQTNKLAIIYLLEMAACGEGPDQRSFSERARRLLREHFVDKEDEEKTLFFDFYDLLARFSNGLGYQHEEQSRKAALEYNLIIKALCDNWTKEGEITENTPGKNKDYVHKRHGLELLYLPAVLGRANLQIKLQIAYHAIETLDDYWKKPKGEYLTAKRACLLAEANRLLGDHDSSEKNLHEVANILYKKCRNNNDNSEEPYVEWVNLLQKISINSKQEWANIQDRLLDTYVAVHFEKLKSSSSPFVYLKQICEIFPLYLKSSKWQTANRRGYLESISVYLGWLAEYTSGDKAAVAEIKSIAPDIYKNIYVDNKPLHLNSEMRNSKDKDSNSSDHCYHCSNLTINFERLDANHYQEFVKNMQSFYREFKTGHVEDLNSFQEKIFKIEIDHKEDSAFIKRQMALNQFENKLPYNWCERCIATSNRTAYSKLFDWCKRCIDIFPEENAFSGLLPCHKPNKKKGEPSKNRLNSEDYEHLMRHWEARFLRHLKIKSVHLPHSKALHILGLQRWNSTSPAIGRSLGGGYLIYHTNLNGEVDFGIAVDPGFDFIRNLFHLGFSLSDIDVVLLSHAHLDHIRDFESLVTLCLELNKRDPNKVKRKLHTIMTMGVYRRLSHIFESPSLREYVEPYILDIKKEINPEFIKPYIKELGYFDHLFNPNQGPIHKPVSGSGIPQFVFQMVNKSKGSDNDQNSFTFRAVPFSKSGNNNGLCISITATRAYHNDFSEYSDSFGFKVRVSENSRDISTIGYTGDTSWSPDIIEQYKDCDALLIHIGSLIDHNKKHGDRKKLFDDYNEPKECWKLIKGKNHPYLFGLLQFLTEIAKSDTSEKAPLVILSEFGEELRGRIRLDLLDRLSNHYNGEGVQKRIPLLPLDVGLDIILNYEEARKHETYQVKCMICDNFVCKKQVDFETYGHDEALYCVCNTCRKSTPQNVLQDKLRDLYEIARPLQSYK